ncbi:hypothetical protein HCG51_01810 [Tolypothrix sp. PCC 7910]|uniref:hypothetical protein n=1 Tax=Tolypothrix sp. PCC 7910 TaxID=2099387 RepID=UPI001427961B|nr:hypothetical protein [Tolypothrix sp. PCC 7910]QIR35613.1 hypothetical protein HCG51_01810 [Tolypothrix sp. PCC 7910]
MSGDNLELARNGNIKAMAILIEDKTGIKVAPKMLFGITLKLTTKSLAKQKCLQVIEVLESIDCQIKNIQISGTILHRYFSLKAGKYVENTASTYAVTFALTGGLLILANIFYKPPVRTVNTISHSSNHVATDQRTFLGK